MKTFFGRKEELELLTHQLNQKKATLITVQGRRRIGKSTLIKHFVKINSSKVELFEFQGLAPRPELTHKEQLQNFADTLAQYINVKKIELTNWTSAFEQLEILIRNKAKKQIIFLDEISWMGAKDPDFCGKLKIVWDRSLSHQKNLILVLCGSVSSWIQENILENTGFVGRVSLEIKLDELSISESYQMLKSYYPKLSIDDFAQVVSITGGVPRYLEEFNLKENVENNVKKLVLSRAGFLFNEFEKIFAEIFGKKNALYTMLLEAIKDERLTPSEIAKKIDHPLNGDFSRILTHLELGGFIKKELSWNFKGSPTRIAYMRISDNYTRFYLKFIHPKKSIIVKKALSFTDVLGGNWAVSFGYQFENLVVNNANKVLELIGIPIAEVVQYGPYYQRGTKLKKGVQIDLLIQARKGHFYLCEIKSGKKISKEVIEEVKDKTYKLKLPKFSTVRHYLIYLGELASGIEEEDFFDKLIPFDNFL